MITQPKCSPLRIVISLCFFLVSSGVNAQVTSDFATSADGWVYLDGGTGSNASPTYSTSGGNPTGNISFTQASGALGFYWIAPAKFLGNLSSSYNKNLSFDLKVSTAGTDNSIGDIIVTSASAGITLYYQLPAKPAAGAWSPYTVQLNESQWHNGCVACSAPTQVQMKQTLQNVSKIQIRAKYVGASAGPYTSQLDNVTLNTLSFGASPSIVSFSPSSGLPGATVTITGTNFNSTPAQNAVYFKGIKATVTNATSTQLTVIVPTSANFGPLTVINLVSGLQGVSTTSFNPLFDNNKDYGGRIIPASMSRGYSTVLPMSNSGNSFGGIDKGDLDGDGWTDLVVTETGTAKIYAYQNLGTGGAVSASSFSSAITLPSMASIPGGGPGLSEVIVVDVDSDGKLDVAASTSSNLASGTGFLTIFRNTSTPGTISFASPVFFSYAYYSAIYMATGDLDGDGRTDFVFTTGSSPGNVFVSQNLSTPGNIDFAFGAGLGFGGTSGYADIIIADLSGDGKPEVIATGYNATNISIYQNNSTPGAIALVAPFTIPSVVSYTVQIIAADLDADNKLDLAWSVYGAQYVYFAQNQSSGSTLSAASFGSTIQIANTVSNPSGISVGDINADGKPDVVLSGYSDMGIMQNVSSAGALSATSFSPTTLMQGSSSGAALYGIGPVIADLDGDNKPEVAFVYSNSSVPTAEKGIYIFHNECYPVPSVSNFSPASANTGSTVSLNGNLLNTGSTSPSIRLNKVLSTLSGVPSNTSVSVVTPSSGVSGKFAVTNHGLTGTSPYFKSTFGTSHLINSSAFGPTVDFALANGTVYSDLDLGDFDDDGKMDFVIRDANGTDIFHNVATAGQTISSSSLTKLGLNYSGGVGSVCFDFDGDGKIDLNDAYANFQNTTSGSTISFGTATYTNVSSYTGAISSDFNKDGKIDVALVNASTTIRIYENLSTRGTFQNTGSFSTFNTNSVNLTLPANSAGNGGLVAEDFDGDGYDDIIAVVPSTNQYSVFLNAAQASIIKSSSFSVASNSTTSGIQPQGIAAGDFDGDGKTDMAICYFNSTKVSVYKNSSTTGNISFGAPLDLTAATKGYGITAQDLDGDGKAELIVIHQPVSGSNGSFTIFQNTSTGSTLSFSAGVNYSLTRSPQALAVADINGDQKPDILIVASGGSTAPFNALMVFENKIIIPTISITSQPASVYSVCAGATPAISTAANGTTNITYQWQIFNSGTGIYSDLINSAVYANVSSASMTINTSGNLGTGTYRCKINGDFATTVYTNTVSFTSNALPATPSASDVNFCPPNTVILTASGASNGQYFWYDQNGLIAGQNNSTYTTASILSTTTYSVAVTNGTCVSPQVTVKAVALVIPNAPASSDVNFCPPNSVMFTATGGSNGQYLWYNQNGLINGQNNATCTTPSISSTSNYSVAISSGGCVSAKTNVKAVAQPIPAAPTTSDVNFCSSASVTLTATGGNSGQYLWSDQNGLISGQNNSTYTTPVISSTTSYSVAITNGTCISSSTTVKAVLVNTCAPPTIASEPLATQAGGKITLNLVPLIKTNGSPLDLTSIKVIIPPSSGATATVDANGILTIIYTGLAFTGIDNITIKACDINANCTQQQFPIEVAGNIEVYNGISPDGANPKFIIQFIDAIPETKNNTVSIFDRWENLVWHGTNYDNSSVVFTGAGDSGTALPSGVYFYKIVFASGRKTETGFISLRR
ncbi:hypothetical protein WSM22_13190 [Cytophagales bacterium WSM2-2]|nr:hypothetical protein WSM22_13190 [Cytophagales bacterium WSM2-2]